MAVTDRDLFRAGRKSSARFDVLRPGIDVVILQSAGQDIVQGRSGGASTVDAPIGLHGVWWRLAAGTQYDDSIIYLWNDYANHWSWEPIRDMPLYVFTAELTAINSKFTLV